MPRRLNHGAFGSKLELGQAQAVAFPQEPHRYSVAMTGTLALQLEAHLLRDDAQEDVCFALWRPSTGRRRSTGLVVDLILPKPGERYVHGNASFTSEYFLRAAALATERGLGLALAHSHPAGRGWQRLSSDDDAAERGNAAQTLALTGLPLLGMTLAGDAVLSARWWPAERGLRPDIAWCESTRIIGDPGQMHLAYDELLRPPPEPTVRQRRTVSAWGRPAHERLCRVRVGIVGLGSIGMLVAETLARTGLVDLVMIDFDVVAEHNLDRLLGATRADAATHLPKVAVAQRLLTESATSENVNINPIKASITSQEGWDAALDCDILFSCVDRPAARAALNLAATAHLIPVVDGGVAVDVLSLADTAVRLRGAEWRAHVVTPGRRCLECLGQYDPGLVQADRDGRFDDPTYIAGLPANHVMRRSENVFAFSMAAAAAEVLEFLRLLLAPSGVTDVGAGLAHWSTGQIEYDLRSCDDGCPYNSWLQCAGDTSASPVRAALIARAISVA